MEGVFAEQKHCGVADPLVVCVVFWQVELPKQARVFFQAGGARGESA